MINAFQTSGTSPGTKNKPSLPPMTDCFRTSGSSPGIKKIIQGLTREQFALNSLRPVFGVYSVEIRKAGISLAIVNKLVKLGQVRCYRERGGFPVRYRNNYRTIVSVGHPFPFRCTGSFCHQLNFTDDRRHKLCRPCRDAKLRHNKTERSRPKNVSRANRARRIRRYNRLMERITRSPWLMMNRPRGVELFRRVLGWTRQEAASFLGTAMTNV
jgi:hypothetical protein